MHAIVERRAAAQKAVVLAFLLDPLRTTRRSVEQPETMISNRTIAMIRGMLLSLPPARLRHHTMAEL
jgi:hypothetical protein